MDSEQIKQDIDNVKTVMEKNNKELKKMNKRNQDQIDELQSETKGRFTVIKPMSTKQVVVVCMVLAGVSFIAGRKEGIEVGLEMSKQVNQDIGYKRAMDEVIKQFSMASTKTN